MEVKAEAHPRLATFFEVKYNLSRGVNHHGNHACILSKRVTVIQLTSFSLKKTSDTNEQKSMV